MKIKHLITLASMCFINACSNTPNSVIIAPQVYSVPTSNYVQQQAQLSVTDLRIKNHIIQILQPGQAATLFSPANDMSQTLNNSLSAQFKNQGLVIAPASRHQIKIYIDAALVSVQQETLKYQAASEIRLRVEIKKGSETLTTDFNAKGHSKGPFKADIAVLERDFNQQLGKLITEITQNPDIIGFITHE